MPRIVREATVAWNGSLSRGTGTATASKGAFELPIDLPSRIGDPGGTTSPEELLAAAHAGCYSMSLAGEIARAGGTVERLDVTCTITMDEVPGRGHLVVSSDAFRRAVEAADEGCSFSALLRASASVSVRAELES